MELADSVDASWRATLGTVRYEGLGDACRVVPDFTVAMATDMAFRELPAQDPIPEDFSGLFVPGTADWENFFSTRKVVHRYFDGSGNFASVTSNVVEALDGEVEMAFGRKRPKEYEVAHLLTDVSLVRKFSIRGDFAARMRNLAVVDTNRAAIRLQEHVRTVEGYERAVVVVGRYSGSWKAARDCIKQFAAKHPATSVRTDACVIGDKIFMYGPAGEDDWRVFGPVSCAGLVHAVHKMVATSSCEAVIFAFGMELTLLDIDVHNGNEVLCPVRECHAGDHSEMPLRPVSGVSAMFSRQQMARLTELCGACETFSVDGEDVATAVRVTGRYVLANAHVLRESGAFVSGGTSVMPHRMVSPELWLMRARGNEVAWSLRKAEPNEMVVLCYRRHGELQFLGPTSVKSVGEDVLALGLVPGMMPGMSGAAIVAVSDFSLLGLHDGVSLRSALGAAFTPEMYTEVCTMSELGDSSHASARDEADGMYTRMKERGLGKVVDSVTTATVPLYSGDVHVGMGFPHGGKLLTTCDPDVTPLTPCGGATPLVFERVGPFFSATSAVLPDVGPAVIRSPSYGERVFVVGKDAEGEYVSSTKTNVVHIGVGALRFQIGGVDTALALPLQGGMVVAETDAAVLGVYKSAGYDRRSGSVSHCVAMPRHAPVVVERERPEAVLQRVFPFLRPGAWPDGVAASVLTHPSAGVSAVTAYAMVGDSAARTALWVRLLGAGVPTAKWQGIVQEDQSNAAQAAACERLGLSGAIVVGGGIRLTAGSKVHADVLEAVGGAVHLFETAETFDKYCTAAGLLRDSYDDAS